MAQLGALAESLVASCPTSAPPALHEAMFGVRDDVSRPSSGNRASPSAHSLNPRLSGRQRLMLGPSRTVGYKESYARRSAFRAGTCSTDVSSSSSSTAALQLKPRPLPPQLDSAPPTATWPFGSPCAAASGSIGAGRLDAPLAPPAQLGGPTPDGEDATGAAAVPGGGALHPVLLPLPLLSGRRLAPPGPPGPEELLYETWIASRFSAALQAQAPPPRQKQESEKNNNYYLSVGYAIRTLREELPSMFYRDLTYDIYREDIVFRDPLNVFAGIQNYKLIFWALRFHGRIFFRALWVDVLRIWQPSDKVIQVRWTVRGTPRVPWEAGGQFDGTSEYKLDSDGKIYEHRVDNVVMAPPREAQRALLSVMDLVRAAGGGRAPTPTYIRSAAAFADRVAPYLALFTWVRFYWALTGTLALALSA